jgi:hypothetical protein
MRVAAHELAEHAAAKRESMKYYSIMGLLRETIFLFRPRY